MASSCSAVACSGGGGTSAWTLPNSGRVPACGLNPSYFRLLKIIALEPMVSTGLSWLTVVQIMACNCWAS